MLLRLETFDGFRAQAGYALDRLNGKALSKGVPGCLPAALPDTFPPAFPKTCCQRFIPIPFRQQHGAPRRLVNYKAVC